MRKLYNFWYKTGPDAMPEHVYVASDDYERAWRIFQAVLRELGMFTPNGSIRFWDYSAKGDVDVLGETDAPQDTVGGGGEFSRWMVEWM